MFRYIGIYIYYRYMKNVEHYTVQFMSEGRLMLTCQLHPVGTAGGPGAHTSMANIDLIQQYNAFCQPQRPFLKRTFSTSEAFG